MANPGAFKKGEKRPKQGKRGPNKTTLDVREAIATLAQANVDRCQTWLDRIAEKDPDKAFDLYLKMLEYHVPKLARTELTGAGGGPVIVKMDDADLRA
jgi:hypothetical protein